MHRKDTIIKSSQIKWNSCKPKSVDDGKLDIDMHIPLTSIFEGQAKSSFANGMITMMNFFCEKLIENKNITIKDMTILFQKAGLPELARKIKEQSHAEIFAKVNNETT